VPSGTSFTTPLVLQNLSYSYDEVNNPLLINDFRSAGEWPPDAGPFGATMTYDDLYRLTSVGFAYLPFKKPAKLKPLPPVPQLAPFTSNDPPPISFKMPIDRLQSQTFGYDLMGNVTRSIDDADALLQRSAGTATYGNANSGAITGPNQLAHSQSDNGAYATAYDEAGHLQRATRSEFNYNFDLWNGPIQFGPSSTITNDYLYDGGGTRTWQSSDDTGSTQYDLEIFPSLRVRGTTWGAHEVPCLPGVPCLPLLQYQDYDLTDKTEQVYLVSGAVTYGRLVRDSTLPSPSQQPLHTFLEIADPHGFTSSAIDKETGELVEQITYLRTARPRRTTDPSAGTRFARHTDTQGKRTITMSDSYTTERDISFLVLDDGLARIH
jgi:YD repeat-containing protein